MLADLADKPLEEQCRQAAQFYAEMGWLVFPVFAPDEKVPGRCGCGNPECNSPAKHPRTQHGHKEATRDKERVNRFFRYRCNVAIATGNGLMFVDFDLHKNPRALKEFQAEYGELPETLTSRTGGGGVQLVYNVDRRVPCTSGRVWDAVDIRGDGGYVVAPPSLHISGVSYEWDASKTYKTRKAPAWLVDLAIDVAAKGKVPYEAPDAVLEGGRNQFLASIAGTLHRRGTGAEELAAHLQIENTSRCRPPLGKQEVEKIAKSISSKPRDGVEDRGPWAILKRGKDNTICNTAFNASAILLFQEDLEGCLGYNEFADEATWIKQPPLAPLRPRIGSRFGDFDAVYLQGVLHDRCGVSFPITAIHQAADASARRNSFHPVKDYLNRLAWDQKPRVDDWTVKYLGAEDKPVIRDMGRWWLLSAVARIMYPGCQADHVLVLEGVEGVGKTSAARILGGPWYKGQMPSPANPQAGHLIQGYWIIECGELAALERSSVAKQKEFISFEHDEYRAPYARKAVKRPRQCVFVATTNQHQYLEDTQNRRFWPMRVGKVDLTALARDRDQLWGEAVNRIKEGEKWFPQEKLTTLLEEQEARMIEDPWMDIIKPNLEKMDRCPSHQLYSWVGVDMAQRERRHEMRMAKIMRELGWQKSRKTVAGNRLRLWEKTL